MSILIKGMEMPKYGEWRIVKINPNGEVDRSIGFGDWALIKGLEAIEIPSHGDLIDRDELLSQYGGPIWTAETDYAEGLRDVVADIKNAPTIIEAEPCNDLAKPNNAPTIIPADGGE